MAAEDLVSGDRLGGRGAGDVVDRIRMDDSRRPVFNLEVEHAHEYYVGSTEIRAHNVNYSRTPQADFSGRVRLSEAIQHDDPAVRGMGSEQRQELDRIRDLIDRGFNRGGGLGSVDDGWNRYRMHMLERENAGWVSFDLSGSSRLYAKVENGNLRFRLFNTHP